MSEPSTSNGLPRSPSFLKRVRLRNYKSIASCDVELGPLTILVGRNGSGKSNFLDALRFVGDALRNPFSQAVRSRGGPFSIARKGEGSTEDISIVLDVDLGKGSEATYEIKMGFLLPTWPVVWDERLEIKNVDASLVHSYEAENGKLIRSTVNPSPAGAGDRLYLVNASGFPEFRPVYDALMMMEFYNFSPERMREVQAPDFGDVLSPDGRNIASIVGRIDSDPSIFSRERLLGYLTSIVPGITNVKRESLGPAETLEFEQMIPGSEIRRQFYASSMSDGTLRVLGTLVAAAQLTGKSPPIRLVGIEEPETALHPAAGAALMDALQESAVCGQVVVTTHSPDLIDRVEFDSDRLLIVQMRHGETVIGPIDFVNREIIKEHLMTPGELLRQDMLEPEQIDVTRQDSVPISEAVMVPE